MSAGTDVSYLLVVEWDDSVHRPQVVVHHRLTLPAETRQDELEKFVSETVLPKLASVSTRAGAVVHAYLLSADPGAPERFLELDAPLPPGVQDEVRSFRVIARSPSKLSS